MLLSHWPPIEKVDCQMINVNDIDTNKLSRGLWQILAGIVAASFATGLLVAGGIYLMSR